MLRGELCWRNVEQAQDGSPSGFVDLIRSIMGFVVQSRNSAKKVSCDEVALPCRAACRVAVHMPLFEALRQGLYQVSHGLGKVVCVGQVDEDLSCVTELVVVLWRLSCGSRVASSVR